MMEYFFKLETGCSADVKYREHKENENKFFDTMRVFFEDQGIDEQEYYVTTDCLRIANVSEETKEKFKGQINKDGSFRKNSKVGKAFSKEIAEKEIKCVRILNPWDLGIQGWKFKWRLFDVDNVIYVSIETEDDLKEIPQGFVKIRGSEFYEVLEKE